MTMMTHCPCTGAYLKRFIPAILAGFVFVWLYEFALHVGLLMDTYDTTPQLWRTIEDMETKRGFSILMQFLTVFVLAAIFVKGYQNKGLMEGVRFGVLLGALLGLCCAASYAWMPISSTLAIAWFFGGLVKGIGLGVIFALIYKDPKCGSGTGSCCAK